jgi:hypothetical protein
MQLSERLIAAVNCAKQQQHQLIATPRMILHCSQAAVEYSSLRRCASVQGVCFSRLAEEGLACILQETGTRAATGVDVRHKGHTRPSRGSRADYKKPITDYK